LTITEQGPLSGKRIVVTRAAEQAGEFVRELERRGAEVLALPAVTLADPPDLAGLDEAIGSLERFHWILFTSQNAVRFFAKRCRLLGKMPQVDGKVSTEAQLLIAAVGPATAEAARKEGLRVDYVASEYRGEALAEELAPQITAKRVLLPRSDRGAADLPAVLRASGAEVEDVVAYQTSAPDSFDQGVAETICRGEVDVITFFSPSAFGHLVEEFGMETLRHIVGRVVLAAIGPTTASAIREAGLPVEIEANEATTDALVAAITRHFAERLTSGVN
jgi:uroporphyrinogen III methyltransferase / synthase